MFETELITRTGKNGKEYSCLQITFPNGYKKIVFLDGAEKYLVEMM